MGRNPSRRTGRGSGKFSQVATRRQSRTRLKSADKSQRKTKVTTLLERPYVLQEILEEIGQKDNSHPHVVAHAVHPFRDEERAAIHFELCPKCANGGTDLIIIRIYGPCADDLVLKALFGNSTEGYDVQTVH